MRYADARHWPAWTDAPIEAALAVPAARWADDADGTRYSVTRAGQDGEA